MKSISIFFLLGLSCLHISAQKHKVLFLGNSYTAVNNLPSLFTALALSGGDTVITDANTPGGYTFQGHSTNLTSLSKIQADAWDYVILQEQSQLPSFPPSQVATDCFPYAKILDSLIHINDACTKTVFYMTWGRKYGDASNCASYPPVCTFDGMQTRLRDSYVQMGDDNQAYVAPVGMAWKAARLADSTINLWSADNSHPSMAGSYLAACVFYATLFEKTPVGLTYTSGLPTNTVNFLQNIAHHTVFDSLSTWNIGEFDPVSAFSYTQNGYGISLQENSDFATSFHWELGNGDTLNGENVSYTYPYPGSYLLKLIAYNDCGKSDTSTQEITVSPPIWAYQQAQSLEKGINLSYLENYWAGNPNIHYSDYLHSLPNVSTYKNDIALMAEMGFKTLRLPICFDVWEDNIPPYTIDSTSYFQVIDSLIGWSTTNGMKVIIDYHHGNFTSSNYAIQKGRIQHMWEQIATHFMNYPSNEVFYELYNEPNTITTPELREALVSWISTIRQIDAERTLIVSGTEWGGINGLKSIGALPDSNLIYSFHFYEPFIFTHQGASWVGDPVATTGIPYPYDAATMPPIHPLTVGTWAENAYNYYPTSGTNATIANWLGEANAWRDTTQLPIFCGEWGTYKPFAPDDGSRCRYIEAMKTILDSMAIPYCYWEWDGGFSFFEGNPSLDSISVCMANIWDIQTIDIDDKMASMIQIFPNPVTQKLFIQNTSPSQIQFVQILDIHGKVVLYQEEYQAGISLENLPSGMYFLTIQTNIDRGTWKIIKQ